MGKCNIIRSYTNTGVQVCKKNKHCRWKNTKMFGGLKKPSQFSRTVVSESLWCHGVQHARLPCPSPIPGACSYSCPLTQWCHPTISSFVVPFSSCLWSWPASGAFPVSQFRPKNWSFSFSISPSSEYSRLISFRIGCLISLKSKGIGLSLQSKGTLI